MYEKADPDGDLLITLQPAIEPFAPWPTKTKTPAKSTGERARSPEPKESLQVLVSSKHMTKASPRFKKMLTGSWVEATTIHPDGLRHVDMEGFDIEAFMTVMHIIHTNNNKLPHTMDTEKLAKIAVVVDDLQCHEVISLWAKAWLKKLKNLVPNTCDRGLILWILISHTFRQPLLFQRVTRTAILSGVGPLPTLGLPIRQKVARKLRWGKCMRRSKQLTLSLERLDSAREFHIQCMMTALKTALCKLRSDKHPLECSSKACHALLLGCFSKAMSQASPPLHPRPSMPYLGYSIGSIAETVQNIETPKWIALDMTDSGSRANHANICNVNEVLRSRHIWDWRVYKLSADSVHGLDIDTLLPW